MTGPLYLSPDERRLSREGLESAERERSKQHEKAVLDSKPEPPRPDLKPRLVQRKGA